MSALIIASCIVSFLFFRSIYHFFIKQASTSQKGVKMQTIYKYITTLYFCEVLLFLLLDLIFQVYVIFFNGSIYCWIIDYSSGFYFLSRTSVHIMFYLRLKISFSQTAFGISSKLQAILITFIIIGPIGAITYGLSLIYLKAHDSPRDSSCATSFNYASAVSPFFAVDFLIVFLLVYLFIGKLAKMLKLANEMHQVSCCVHIVHITHDRYLDLYPMQQLRLHSQLILL